MATTPNGKAVSARNSTTHGVFSQQTVLPHLGEDTADFDALLHELTAQYAPRNTLDHHYVEQIACALWRLRRLGDWETELLTDPDLPDDERHKQWERVLRLDAMLRRQIDKAVKVLSVPAAQNCPNELASVPNPPVSGGPCAKQLVAKRKEVGSPLSDSPSIAALRHARQQKLRKRTG